MWGIGGFQTPYARNDVWYSSDGINWTQATASAAWTPRTEHTSVVFSGKIWVIGGLAGTGYTLLEDKEIWYSSDGVNWTQAPSLTFRGTSRSPAIIHYGKIWFIGAGNGNTIYSSSDGLNWLYESTATWSTRSYHTSASFEGKVWVIGGGFTRPYLNDVWYCVFQ